MKKRECDDMKFVTFFDSDGVTLKPGVLLNDNLVADVQQAQRQKMGDVTIKGDLFNWIEQGESYYRDIVEIVDWAVDHQHESFIHHLKDLRLAAPISRPRKNIFCIGKNYADHAREFDREAELPKHPLVFSKPPTTISHPNSSVSLHADVTDFLDYEGELAVVIGKRGKGIRKEEVYDHVFGYTLINDISARDVQARHQQFLLGKSLDGSCPMGPCIVHKSEIDDPSRLHIETKVNADVRQSADTSLMIFDIPTLISVISAGTTLEAGDVIATGTPAGVGKGMGPPQPLKDGDVVEIAVEGIGRLKNTISGT
jgi:2-keto-4-pentenoate hydratase/2-oxohepta-3-ene-1,7-dioic acid hydratase in catechol pathway